MLLEPAARGNEDGSGHLMRKQDEIGLVGDIGATNARFALVGSGHAIKRTRVVAAGDYPGIAEAITGYLEAEADGRPDQAVLAVASPVTGDSVTFTNSPWTFSIAELRQRLGLRRLEVINDLTATALAIPHLPESGRVQIGPGQPVLDAPVGIIGPGTGLGVGALLRAGKDWMAVPSEGGHVTMAPGDGRESAVLDLMRRRFDHVSAERVISGPGLVNLYNALCETEGVPAASYTAAQITDPGIRARDPRCQETVVMFCAMLGTIAGNLALTLGARGGVYISGGIVPKLGATFAQSAFRARFEQKGRMRAYLAPIPTYVITHAVPAFLGAATLLDAKATADR
jgi:glucokinase